jgi:hypothetical protein
MMITSVEVYEIDGLKERRKMRRGEKCRESFLRLQYLTHLTLRNTLFLSNRLLTNITIIHSLVLRIILFLLV